MKQHITEEQLKEIDKINSDFILDADLLLGLGTYKELCKQVTISKMIEMLDNIQKDEIFISRLEDLKWQVCLDLEISEYGDYNFNESKYELCDVLFKALCYVLKKEVD